MGLDSNSSPAPSASTPTASPNGKRTRDPEDEVYIDNLHSHKRYLSEIMASSLNGLTVGDPLSENIMESPARSDSFFYARDDMSIQYSPMSEDSEDSRYPDTPVITCSSQPDSVPTSPVSPYRYQRPFGAFPSAASSPYPPHGATASTISGSQSRQRGSDSEGRFPSSPSDICHSADLRRAALLRSVQMRAQPSGASCPFELPFGSGQEPVANMEAEERPCSYMKALVDERDYHIEERSSSASPSGSQFDDGKSCRVLDMERKDAPGG